MERLKGEGQPDYASYQAQSRSEKPSQSKKHTHLSRQVDQLCKQCVDTVRLLDGLHRKQLMGSEVHPHELELVTGEISVLQGIVKEHEELAIGSPKAIPLILKEKARLDQLVQKLETVKSHQKVLDLNVQPQQAPQSPALKAVIAQQMVLAKARVDEAARTKSTFTAVVVKPTVAFPKQLNKLSATGPDSQLFKPDLVDGGTLSKLGNEVAKAADDVLRAERYAEQIDPSPEALQHLHVIHEAVTNLKERLGGLEISLAKAAVHFPGSRFQLNLEERVSLLRAKLDSLEAHYHALQKMTG